MTLLVILLFQMDSCGHSYVHWRVEDQSFAQPSSPHPSHISANSAGKEIDVLSSTITSENCFKRGMSTFSLSNRTSARRCMIFRNILAHSGVKRWLIADSVTLTSLLHPTCANPLKRISGSCQNPKINICTNVTTSNFPSRFTAPVS